MIPGLKRQNEPGFLNDISLGGALRGFFPRNEILSGSLFYPSSGFDGDPIRHLAGNFFSFVYADYGRSLEEFNDFIGTGGFEGYHPIASRLIDLSELAPGGWVPAMAGPKDGDPLEFERIIESFFCVWSVFEKKPAGSVFEANPARSDHETKIEVQGVFPERFSLLYVCADGVAAFQSLFVSSGLAPGGVAVIQPGRPLGFNWTRFEDPQGILARLVLENPAGQPETLLFGGSGRRDRYARPCWPGYGKKICFLEKSPAGLIGVWVKSPLGSWRERPPG